jgi:hypothetical protein
MNSFTLTQTFRTVLFSFAACSLLSLAASAGRTTAQIPNTQTRSTTTWQQNDDGRRRRVAITGKAQFTEDYSDVSGLSEGGLLILEEDRNGESRRLEVRRNQDGQLIRRYFVNGEARALNEQGRKWMAELLLNAVRQGAIDVDRRVTTILRQGGVSAMLDEIASISGDYGRRIYFESLLQNQNLSRADMQRVLERAGSQLSSDYEKANLLKKTAESFLGDSTLRKSFFQTIGTIHSDYERRGALSALLKKQNLNEEVLSQLLDAAAGISSDYEKATFLLQASSLYTGNPVLRSAFLKTVETIKSDHERGRVLTALLRNKQLS